MIHIELLNKKNLGVLVQPVDRTQVGTITVANDWIHKYSEKFLMNFGRMLWMLNMTMAFNKN